MPPKGFIAFCWDFIELCVGWIYQLKSYFFQKIKNFIVFENRSISYFKKDFVLKKIIQAFVGF